MRLNGIIQMNPYTMELVTEAIQYLSKKYPVYISAEQLAMEVNLDIKKLQAGFKRSVGFTVHQYQIHLRIEQAKSDLADFRLSVKLISYRNGFKDTSQFGKIFKKNVGQTPLEYRERLTPKGNHLYEGNDKG
jgi:iron complex transport system substrate-binding protein